MHSDYHTHTHFSYDSSADTEEMIKKAISLGMKEYCVTDHYDMYFLDEIFTFDVDEYFKEMNAYKERFKNEIRLVIGVEIGLDTEHADEISRFAKSWPFEYVIGSVHKLFDKDPYERELYDIGDEEFYRDYFKCCAECIRACSGFDTFGHLDYVVRYGYTRAENYTYAAYAKEIDDILKAVIDKGVALEVNTAGLAKGVGFAHPHPDVLQRYIALGGRKYNMGSDAHSPEFVGYHFENTENALNKLVFLESIR